MDTTRPGTGGRKALIAATSLVATVMVAGAFVVIGLGALAHAIEEAASVFDGDEAGREQQ